jgi:hypothetical protein
MSLRLVSFTSISALLLIAVTPAFAGDTGIIQKNFQGSATTGNGNTSINENKQIYLNNKYSNSGNTGVSQDNAQMHDTQGHGNFNVNQNSQEFQQELIQKYRNGR